MTLEAVMICVDNSDYTINSDYQPTRHGAMIDAANFLCAFKTQRNMENSVGVLTTAGQSVDVRLTPTSDLGRIQAELPKINAKGNADLVRGIQTAQLALKHRQNKNQKQRIIAFVASPVRATDKELETLGKNLKKNNVSLDLVSFGEVEENSALLNKLISVVGGTSNIVEVPPGPKLLSDVLRCSPIVDADGGEGGGGGGGGDFQFGIDPSEDPELALALRISMEEERARQGGGGEATEAPAAAPAATTAETAAPPAAGPAATDAAVLAAMEGEDMDEELRAALLLSMQDVDDAAPAAAPEAAAAAEAAPAAPAASAEAAPASGEQEAPDAAAAPADPMATTVESQWFQDPDFMNELIGSLPGVDPNDPRVLNAVQEINANNQGGGGGAGGSGGGGDAASGDADAPEKK